VPHCGSRSLRHRADGLRRRTHMNTGAGGCSGVRSACTRNQPMACRRNAGVLTSTLGTRGLGLERTRRELGGNSAGLAGASSLRHGTCGYGSGMRPGLAWFSSIAQYKYACSESKHSASKHSACCGGRGPPQHARSARNSSRTELTGGTRSVGTDRTCHCASRRSACMLSGIPC
jgi:hypothetical protein